MRERKIVHVAGLAGAGKTTFIERLLDAHVALALCVRGERDPTVPRAWFVCSAQGSANRSSRWR